jgi:membrane protease YdiL (CAAX protease family)
MRARRRWMSTREPERRARDEGYLVAVTVFYGLMALLAWGLAALFDVALGDVTIGTPEAWPHHLAAAAGAGAGLVCVLCSRPLLHAGIMAEFRTEVRASLGRPGPVGLLVLAATSAIGEELLFRGTLQALLGLWPTVLIFGLLHGGGARRLLGWTLFALAAGVALGLLATATGSLLAPIVMHFTINYFNLGAITAEAPLEDPP